MLVEGYSSLRLLNGSTMDSSILQIWACEVFYGVEVAMLHLLVWKGRVRATLLLDSKHISPQCRKCVGVANAVM